MVAALGSVSSYVGLRSWSIRLPIQAICEDCLRPACANSTDACSTGEYLSLPAARQHAASSGNPHSRAYRQGKSVAQRPRGARSPIFAEYIQNSRPAPAVGRRTRPAVKVRPLTTHRVAAQRLRTMAEFHVKRSRPKRISNHRHQTRRTETCYVYLGCPLQTAPPRPLGR